MFFAKFIDKAERSGPAFTTLDLMKFFAIVNMTCDHIGMYFAPEELWWRAIGRITFPVWFFLVGFSRGRSIPRSLWIYAIILIAVHPFVYQPVFPTNALMTIILCRYALNFCEDRGWMQTRLPEMAVAGAVLSLVTYPLTEYGSVGFLYALIGWYVRREQNHSKQFYFLLCVSYAIFIFWQTAFDFTLWQMLYVLFGTALVVGWLARCRIQPLVSDWKKYIWLKAATILSRNTLEYYFYHRLLFQIIAALMFVAVADRHFSWIKW